MLFARAFFAVATLLTLSAKAAPLNDLMDQLRDTGVNYEIVGTVCEQVAALELRQKYPVSTHHIVTGIEYGDDKRTIGELDVVVFEKSTKQAVLVAEVKCWKNMSAARQKAMDQRQRFIRSLGKKIQLHDHDTDYDKSQFKNVKSYAAIAPQGSRAAGFEIELENNLKELMQLRKMMMQCQQQGECARATRGH